MAEDQYVKVVVRVRPLLEHEVAKGMTCKALKIEGNDTIRMQYNKSSDKCFKFDRVFPVKTSQKEVFAHIRPLIGNVISGFNSTVFAYGQTGSGKTFTMEGYDYEMMEKARLKPVLDTDSDQLGVTLRCIQDVFDEVEKCREAGDKGFTIRCSYMQLYNEKVYDLLNPNATLKAAEKKKGKDAGLRVRWDKGDTFFVENLFVFEVESAAQVIELYQTGVKNKVMSSHQMNLASSRSHSIFTIYLTTWELSDPDCVIESQLSLVDLAGSEKLRMLAQNPSSKLVQESIDINTSLLALGKVIQALAGSSSGPNQHIPYRESKLTKLLKHALGGNSMTVMVACVTPADDYTDETLSTLFYAGRAQNIRNDPRINEDPKTALIRSLKQEIESLKGELNHYRQILLDRGIDASGLSRTGSGGGGGGGGVGGGAIGMESNVLAQKLVRSVEMLKEVRENFDSLSKAKTKIEVGYNQLSRENTNLRERVEMLESIVLEQADDPPPPNIGPLPSSGNASGKSSGGSTGSHPPPGRPSSASRRRPSSGGDRTTVARPPRADSSDRGTVQSAEAQRSSSRTGKSHRSATPPLPAINSHGAATGGQGREPAAVAPVIHNAQSAASMWLQQKQTMEQAGAGAAGAGRGANPTTTGANSQPQATQGGQPQQQQQQQQQQQAAQQAAYQQQLMQYQQQQAQMMQAAQQGQQGQELTPAQQQQQRQYYQQMQAAQQYRQQQWAAMQQQAMQLQQQQMAAMGGNVQPGGTGAGAGQHPHQQHRPHPK